MSTTAGRNNDKTDSVNRSAVKTRLSRKIQDEAERIAREYAATAERDAQHPNRLSTDFSHVRKPRTIALELPCRHGICV